MEMQKRLDWHRGGVCRTQRLQRLHKKAAGPLVQLLRKA